MPLAMVHDAVGEVFGYSRKLGENLRAGIIEVDFVGRHRGLDGEWDEGVGLQAENLSNSEGRIWFDGGTLVI